MSQKQRIRYLARGGYDPKEHRFLRRFADAYPEFKVGYTRLVVIATDNQLDINEFVTPWAPSGRSCPTPSDSCG